MARLHNAVVDFWSVHGHVVGLGSGVQGCHAQYCGAGEARLEGSGVLGQRESGCRGLCRRWADAVSLWGLYVGG